MQADTQMQFLCPFLQKEQDIKPVSTVCQGFVMV